MGRNIRLPEEEYLLLTQEMKSIHKDVLQVVEHYLTEMDSLLVEEGGFHADLISDKAKLVLQLFREKTWKELESQYQRSEETLRLYADKIQYLDQSGKGKMKCQRSI